MIDDRDKLVKEYNQALTVYYTKAQSEVDKSAPTHYATIVAATLLLLGGASLISQFIPNPIIGIPITIAWVWIIMTGTSKAIQ